MPCVVSWPYYAACNAKCQMDHFHGTVAPTDEMTGPRIQVIYAKMIALSACIALLIGSSRAVLNVPYRARGGRMFKELGGSAIMNATMAAKTYTQQQDHGDASKGSYE